MTTQASIRATEESVVTATNIGIAIECVLCAAFSILISIPLLQKKVKMNRTYGVRIKKAFTSNENWYKINHYGAKRLIIWSIPLFVVGVLALFMPFGSGKNANDLLVLAFALAPVLVFIPVIVDILIFARKL